MVKRLTNQDFIDKAQAVHGLLYDYSKVEYLSAKRPVLIGCPTHGEFLQKPEVHVNLKSGCPKCGAQRIQASHKWTLEDFLEKAREKHGVKYDYAAVVYTGYEKPVRIGCPQHGFFEQTPAKHLTSTGCPQCGRQQAADSKKTRSASEFVERAQFVHSDRYDYSQSVFISVKEPVLVVCKDHGGFQVTPDNHIRGSGCPECAVLARAESIFNSAAATFVSRAQFVHGDTYDYSLVDYQGVHEKVSIICKDHGVFQQMATNHLSGHGCPRCGGQESRAERELFEFVQSICPSAVRRSRSIIPPQEIDIFIPEKGIGIEFNGLYFHSEASSPETAELRHYNKRVRMESEGFRLLHIYEDDWRFRRGAVEHTLRHLLGAQSLKFGARMFQVEDLSQKAAVDFYDKFHILGAPRGGRTVALTREGVPYAAMTFCKVMSERTFQKEGRFELIRFASGCSVAGAGSKLFKHFLRTTPGVQEVVSYSDNDLFPGGIYQTLGFELIHEVPPDYKVIMNRRRYHKSRVRRDALAKLFPETFDPDQTEHANCLKHGIYRIYNSGLRKWVFTSPCRGSQEAD